MREAGAPRTFGELSSLERPLVAEKVSEGWVQARSEASALTPDAQTTEMGGEGLGEHGPRNGNAHRYPRWLLL